MANGFQAVPGGRINLDAAEAVPGGISGLVGQTKKGLGGITTGTVGKMGGGLLAGWLLQKLLETTNQMQDIGVQRQGLRSQAESITPERLYYQAALPRAQQEESMARTAMLNQLSGGVLGPSLARGEMMIGGP